MQDKFYYLKTKNLKPEKTKFYKEKVNLWF